MLSVGQPTTAIGFGRTSNGGSLSDVLLKVDVNIVSYQTCRIAYGDDIFNNVMVCAGGNGKDACQGDSGGTRVVVWKKDACSMFEN